jgi:hypothetical protein
MSAGGLAEGCFSYGAIIAQENAHFTAQGMLSLWPEDVQVI